MKKIYIFSFAAFLISSINILHSQCLAGWTYATPITITNGNPVPLVNFQVKITVNTAALVSAGHMQASGSDIRFTEGNCCNSLFYTIDNGMNTSATDIWVKVDSIPASGSVIVQMNYGNPSAISTGNAAATFDMWEPFDSTVNHFTYAGCGSGVYNVAGGIADINWPVNFILNSDITFDMDTVYTAEMMVNSASGNWPGINFSGTTPGAHYGYSVLLGGGSVRLGKSGSSAGDYCRGENWAGALIPHGAVNGLWSVTWISTGNIIGDFPGVGAMTSTDTEFPRNQDMKVCLGGISSGSGAMNLDWVRVRKYAQNTPGFSVGSESSLSFQFVSLGNDTTVCDITSGLLFDAGAGFTSYTWSGIATGSSQTTTINSTGSVIITAVDASSCPSSDTLLVSEWPPVNVNIGVDQTICSGDTVTLDAGAGFLSYDWSSGGSTQIENVSTAGNYIVNVTDVNGCSGTDTVLVGLFPQPTSSFTFSSASLNTTFTNTSTGGSSYLWDFGDGNTSTAFDTAYIFAVPGTYNVCLTVTSSDNCETTFCTNVVVTNTGLNNELLAAGIKIYPNPATNIIWINSLTEQKELKFFITDMLGKMVLGNTYQNLTNQSVDVSSLNPGNYIIQIVIGDQHYYTSFIISR